MKALCTAFALAGLALTGCYTEPKVTVNTQPATSVVGAPPATSVVTPSGAVVTPAPGTTVVVPNR